MPTKLCVEPVYIEPTQTDKDLTEALDALENIMANPDSVDATAAGHAVLTKHNRMRR